MNLKEKMEEKLFNLFYSLGLDEIYKKAPSAAVIKTQEGWVDEEVSWSFENNILKIYMYAGNYEIGAKYVAAEFLESRIMNDPEDNFSKLGSLILLLFLLMSFGNIFLIEWIGSLFLGLAISCWILNLIGWVFLYYKYQKWTRIKKDYFKKKVNELPFNYSSEELNHFTKMLLEPENTYFILGFISGFILLILGIVMMFFPMF